MTPFPVPQSPCGCKYEPYLVSGYIVYCPLHASASELLEAVKTFDKYIRNHETGEHGECKLCKLITTASSEGSK